MNADKKWHIPIQCGLKIIQKYTNMKGFLFCDSNMTSCQKSREKCSERQKLAHGCGSFVWPTLEIALLLAQLCLQMGKTEAETIHVSAQIETAKFRMVLLAIMT